MKKSKEFLTEKPRYFYKNAFLDKLQSIFKNYKNFKIIKRANKTNWNDISFLCFVDKKTSFEGYNRISSNVSIIGSHIGVGTSISTGCQLSNCKIGKFTSIGSEVLLVSSTHTLYNVSTHPGFYDLINHQFPFSKMLINEKLRVNRTEIECIIGNDVWIGTHVFLKSGIKIGDGAIIGMGAVVTHNVPPYAIVAGNPAKIIGFRFADEIIKKLSEIRWWDWELERIYKLKDSFSNIDYFMKEVEHEFKK